MTSALLLKMSRNADIDFNKLTHFPSDIGGFSNGFANQFISALH
jgi:hypothetical protein